MGKTKYKRAKEFLEALKKQKRYRLSFDDFVNEMRINIGADEERTIKPYLKLMMDLKLIKGERKNVRIK